MEILGIILGFAILILMTYKGWSVYLASFLGACAVILLAGLPLEETLATGYIGGIGGIVTSLLGMFLFSAVMARLYAVSGAAASISLTLCGALLREEDTPARRQLMGVLMVILSSALICYGGINAAIVIITIYPIALAVFEKCDIPKRFAPGVILGGCVTFSLSGPGTPQPTNLIPASILGTSPSAGLVPGLVGMAVEIVVMVAVLQRMISRAKAKGERFAYGPRDTAVSPEQKLPPFLVSLLPLAMLFVLFNLLGVGILFCTLAAAVLSLVLFLPYLDRAGLREEINQGFASALTPVGSIGAVFGFASCVQRVPAFQEIVDAILGMELDPFLMCMLAVALLCALTGGSTTGQSIVLPIVGPVLQAKGMAPALIHRIAAFSATTLDSLPYSGTILMTLSHADLRMKDAYPAIFVSTTLATTAAAGVVTLLLYLFPGLA